MSAVLTSDHKDRITRTMEALQANNMEAYYVGNAAEVCSFVERLIPEKSTVSNGGSMSLVEAGVIPLLSSGRYHYLDRSRVAPQDVGSLYREVFHADWYLCSSNAVTEMGELYNVDGNANRIAAIAFGPANVLMVVGINKLVPDIAAAEERVRTVAAPANAARLGCATPCTITGRCADCSSPDRICCSTLICRQQRQKGRIKVLIVGEPLGF